MTQLNNITHNVHEHCGTKVERVQGDIDRDIYAYFFNHVIPYRHGARQAMVNFFFQKFYEACQDAGIAGVYDPDDDEGARLVELLNRMNFKNNVVVIEQKKPRGRKPKL
jgi:hypothetical protein